METNFPTFGLIAEGVTDHAVLENILIGYFDYLDLSENIRILQPLRDVTDAHETEKFGGWYNVFEYCKSEEFLQAFEQNDFLIIQIDTDCSHEKHFDVAKEKDIFVFIEKVKNKLQNLMIQAHENDFYEKNKNRILFAIAVDEIECWLLPLYFSDKNKSATNNCIFKLNQQLSKQNLKVINPKDKKKNEYDKISKSYRKQKELMRCATENPSFLDFIEQLKSRF